MTEIEKIMWCLKRVEGVYELKKCNMNDTMIKSHYYYNLFSDIDMLLSCYTETSTEENPLYLNLKRILYDISQHEGCYCHYVIEGEYGKNYGGLSDHQLDEFLDKVCDELYKLAELPRLHEALHGSGDK